MVALALGFAWSCALIVGAFTLPAYSSDGSNGSGSATLVEENGAHVVGVIAIPFVVTLLVACALWKRRALRSAGPTAWTITVLLVVFNVLALLSIGLFVLPVTICLVVACAQHNSGTVVAGAS